MSSRNNHYWRGKDERAKEALSWYKRMEKEYKSDIEKSIAETKVYNDSTPMIVVSDRRENMEIEYLAMDTVSALDFTTKNHVSGKKFCVLNFASFKNPGGMFLKGSSAQEESLCHESTLYNVLETFNDTFYAENRNCKRRNLYRNRLLYSPNILFIREGSIPFMLKGKDKTGDWMWRIYSDVITCAAPNRHAAVYGQYHVDPLEAFDTMVSRIDFILNVAYAEHVDYLILGAFGCGVFGNNPQDVALIFHTMLQMKYANCFDKVAFAIPPMNRNDKTMDTFVEIGEAIKYSVVDHAIMSRSRLEHKYPHLDQLFDNVHRIGKYYKDTLL